MAGGILALSLLVAGLIAPLVSPHAPQRQDYQSAVEHLLQANMNGPYDTYYLSRAYAGAGDTGKAKELLERAVNWNADSQFYSLIWSEAEAAL